jgi:hypothetical protein
MLIYIILSSIFSEISFTYFKLLKNTNILKSFTTFASMSYRIDVQTLFFGSGGGFLLRGDFHHLQHGEKLNASG